MELKQLERYHTEPPSCDEEGQDIDWYTDIGDAEDTPEEQQYGVLCEAERERIQYFADEEIDIEVRDAR
jgi:phage terminase large subunit GpA-like protein